MDWRTRGGRVSTWVAAPVMSAREPGARAITFGRDIDGHAELVATARRRSPITSGEMVLLTAKVDGAPVYWAYDRDHDAVDWS